MVEPFMADDFEQDQGWYVEEMNMQDGSWERGDPVATSTQPGNGTFPRGVPIPPLKRMNFNSPIVTPMRRLLR